MPWPGSAAGDFASICKITYFYHSALAVKLLLLEIHLALQQRHRAIPEMLEIFGRIPYRFSNIFNGLLSVVSRNHSKMADFTLVEFLENLRTRYGTPYGISKFFMLLFFSLWEGWLWLFFFSFKEFIFGSVYWPDCLIWNVFGWVPCVQVTSHLECIRLVTCVQVSMSGQ